MTFSYTISSVWYPQPTYNGCRPILFSLFYSKGKETQFVTLQFNPRIWSHVQKTQDTPAWAPASQDIPSEINLSIMESWIFLVVRFSIIRSLKELELLLLLFLTWWGFYGVNRSCKSHPKTLQEMTVTPASFSFAFRLERNRNVANGSKKPF